MANKAPKLEERKRRSERVLLRIPIEVKGTGADGKPFAEQTSTLVVNRDGARISLKARVQPNDRVTIVNLRSKVVCPFRIVERATDRMGEGAPEWGVECLEPESNFWGIGFPAKGSGAPAPVEAIDALLECSGCHSRELAELPLEQYRTLVSESGMQRACAKCGAETRWGFGFVEAELEEGIPTPLGPDPERAEEEEKAERRRAKRVTVKLPIRVCLQDGTEEIARTENLSKTGVCFASDLAMKQGDVIRLTVGYAPGSNETEILARVVWRKPVEGMGKALYGVHLEEASDG